MTEEFKNKMNSAMEQGVLVARKQNKEYLEKLAINQKYADLYMELVLNVVRTFDFRDERFHCDKLDENFMKNFGDPKNVVAWLGDDSHVATISLNYANEHGWGRVCEPKFKLDKGYDLEVINDILEENDIHIHENHYDGGGRGSESDSIEFDATMLIEQRKALLEELPNLGKKR